MSGANWVLHVDEEAWEVWRADADGVACLERVVVAELEPQPAASKLAQALQGHGYAGEALALLLPAEQCLCATIATDGLPRRGIRNAMLYRLEDELPIAAEAVVAAFIGAGTHALGVCVPTETWVAVLTAMKAEGLAVELICPAALLIAQTMLDTGAANECDALLLCDAQRIDLVLIENGALVAWHAFAADRNLLELRLHTLPPRTAPLRVALAGEGANEALARIRRIIAVESVAYAEGALREAAAKMAAAVLAGGALPPVNLCEGPLAVASPVGQLRAPLRLAAAAAVLFSACVFGAMWWRASAYEARAHAFTQQQESIFAGLFPGQTPPLSIKSRLRSEYRAAAGVRVGEAAGVTMPKSVLPLLHGVLAALPHDLRYTLDAVLMQERALTVKGRVLSHGSAESLAMAIETTTGWRVPSPRTDLRGDGSVSFILTAVPDGAPTQEAR